jgi:sarcosine oxidase delta subunit
LLKASSDSNTIFSYWAAAVSRCLARNSFMLEQIESLDPSFIRASNTSLDNEWFAYLYLLHLLEGLHVNMWKEDESLGKQLSLVREGLTKSFVHKDKGTISCGEIWWGDEMLKFQNTILSSSRNEMNQEIQEKTIPSFYYIKVLFSLALSFQCFFL